MSLVKFHPVLVSLLLIPCLLHAGPQNRFVGEFNADGSPAYFNTDSGINYAKEIQISSGHTVSEWPDLYKTTKTRNGFSATGKLNMTEVRRYFDDRFDTVISKLVDRNFILQIKRAAQVFSVDPAPVLASIIGEQVFNRSLEMLAQNSAARFMPDRFNFAGAFTVADLMDKGHFSECDPNQSDYWSWICMNTIWNLSLHKANNRQQGISHIPMKYLVPLQGHEETLQGQLRPKTGSSYGIAQLSLARALMLTKDLNSKLPSKYQHLKLEDISEVMNLILDNEATIYLVAANAARCIEVYKKVAGYNISKNLGVIVTLFNLGYEYEKAQDLRRLRLNAERLKTSLPIPKENYMGWYMTEKENEIRKVLEKY